MENLNKIIIIHWIFFICNTNKVPLHEQTNLPNIHDKYYITNWVECIGYYNRNQTNQ